MLCKFTKESFPPFQKVSNCWIYVTESEAFIFLCYVKLPQTKDMNFSVLAIRINCKKLIRTNCTNEGVWCIQNH